MFRKLWVPAFCTCWSHRVSLGVNLYKLISLLCFTVSLLLLGAFLMLFHHRFRFPKLCPCCALSLDIVAKQTMDLGPWLGP